MNPFGSCLSSNNQLENQPLENNQPEAMVASAKWIQMGKNSVDESTTHAGVKNLARKQHQMAANQKQRVWQGISSDSPNEQFTLKIHMMT